MAKRKIKKQNPRKAESDTDSWQWKADYEAQKKRHKEFHRKQKKGKKK